LNRDGIEYFHAKDLDGFWGPFRHLQSNPSRQEIKKNLCADLMALIKSSTYRKFSCTIVNEDFENLTPELREEFALSAYSVAGRTCDKNLRGYMTETYPKTTPFAIVFEDGDIGKGKLIKRLKDDMGTRINFRPQKDKTLEDGLVECGFIPLQAADWLAHEVNLATRKLINTEVESELELRWPMQQFLGPPFGRLIVYEWEDLKGMQDGIELTKKIMEWETAAGLDKLRRERARVKSNDAKAKGKAAQAPKGWE